VISPAAAMTDRGPHPGHQAVRRLPARHDNEVCLSPEVGLSEGLACLPGGQGLDRPWPVAGRTARALMRGAKTSHRLPVVIPRGMQAPKGDYWHQDADDRSRCTWTVTRSSPKLRRWSARVSCPLGGVGTTLWTQESWRIGRIRKGNLLLQWRAERGQELLPGEGAWQRPESQPRRFTRLVLKVTEVRVQRLQSMAVSDAAAEGFASVGAFIESWNSAYPEGPQWSDNPWTWVVRLTAVWERFPRMTHELWHGAAQLDLDLG